MIGSFVYLAIILLDKTNQKELLFLKKEAYAIIAIY